MGGMPLALALPAALSLGGCLAPGRAQTIPPPTAQQAPPLMTSPPATGAPCEAYGQRRPDCPS